MRHWLNIGVPCLMLLGGAILCSGPGTEQVQAVPPPNDDRTHVTTAADESVPPVRVVPQASATCTHYVDNQAQADGDGSLDTPWDNIAGHVNDLTPGDVMCVRGNPSTPGRIYTEPGISLDDQCADGTQASPITIRTYPEEHVVLHSTLESYIVHFQNVSYWRLEGFVLDKETDGGYGIRFEGADFNVVHNCEIYNGSHEAIHLSSGQGNVIEYCTIHDFNAGPYVDAHGILVEAATDTVIQNNEIYDCRGSGVQLWDTGDNSGTIIQDNHIYANAAVQHCCEGAVAVKSGNPIIRHNVMHGFRYCDGSCGGTGGGIGGAAIIYMQAHDVLFEANEIYDCTSGLTVGSANNTQIINNLIHDLVTDEDAWANVGLYVHHSTNVDILNNTLAGIPHNALWIGERAEDLDIRNNLFYDTNQIQNQYSESQVTADYNGWFNAAQRIEGDHDTLGDDPQFVAPDDYHLQGTSPALDTGDNASAPTHDFDGNPRPYGPAPDLGVFEVQGPPPVTDLRVSEGVTTTNSMTVILIWTAPGRVGQSSTADHYELRYDDQMITQENWDQATVTDASMAAGQPGEAQSITVNLPWSGSGPLYFALRVFDADFHGSAVSNPASWPLMPAVFLPLVRSLAGYWPMQEMLWPVSD